MMKMLLGISYGQHSRGGSVASYIAYFAEIIMDLPHASEEELVHGYIYGLKQYIKSNVKAHV